VIVWIAALVHHAKSIGEVIDFNLDSISELTVQVSDQKPLEIVIKGFWKDSQYESLRGSQIVQAYRYFRYLLWLGSDAISEEYEITIPAWKNPAEGESYESIYEKFLSTTSGSKVPRGNKVDCKLLLEATLNRLSIFVLVHDTQTDEPVAASFDT
jgi:hypothetical protein